MTNFSARLRDLLNERGMTQRRLAEQVGCTEAAISHYVKGDRVPRARVLAKIAATLQTTSDYLMEGISQDTESELGYAKKLLARNAGKMSKEEKLEIINILMGNK